MVNFLYKQGKVLCVAGLTKASAQSRFHATCCTLRDVSTGTWRTGLSEGGFRYGGGRREGANLPALVNQLLPRATSVAKANDRTVESNLMMGRQGDDDGRQLHCQTEMAGMAGVDAANRNDLERSRRERWKGRWEAGECDVVLFAEGWTTGAWEHLEAEWWMVSQRGSQRHYWRLPGSTS